MLNFLENSRKNSNDFSFDFQKQYFPSSPSLAIDHHMDFEFFDQNYNAEPQDNLFEGYFENPPCGEYPPQMSEANFDYPMGNSIIQSQDRQQPADSNSDCTIKAPSTDFSSQENPNKYESTNNPINNVPFSDSISFSKEEKKKPCRQIKYDRAGRPFETKGLTKALINDINKYTKKGEKEDKISIKRSIFRAFKKVVKKLLTNDKAVNAKPFLD